MMAARHSPVPFGEPMLQDESGCYVIRDAHEFTTVRAYSAADAAFVRRACNSHEALLAALKEILSQYVELCEELVQGSYCGVVLQYEQEIIKAKAALALAEAE